MTTFAAENWKFSMKTIYVLLNGKGKFGWKDHYLQSVLHSCQAEYFYVFIFIHNDLWLAVFMSGITNLWKAYGATLNPNKRKQQTKLQKLIVDGKTLTEDKDIADGINNYFCTIGGKISSKIKSPGAHFTDYLKNKINKTFFLYLQW